MVARADAYDARTGSGRNLVLVALGVLAAVFAGAIAALAGSMAGTRAVYLVAVPGTIAVAAGFALTRPEPLRVLFLALMAGLPFLAILVPPGRLSFTVFDVASVLLAGGLLLRKAFAAPGTVAPLFPSRSLGFIWLLLIPSVVLARHPGTAAEKLVLMFGAYAFFWFVLDELRRPSGMDRIVGLLSLAVLVVSAGLVIDYFWHINLSLRGSNLNQITKTGGREIWRAGGFFQDPQKAGAFLASLLVFLLVLVVRGRCRSMRSRPLVWMALAAGIPAIFLTVSRAALLAFLVVSVLTLVAANRWSAGLKIAGFGGLLLLAISFVAAPGLWMAVLPSAFAERVANSHDELLLRAEIWMDTWDMFSRHPVTGIGLGGFQQYLLDTRPGVTNYYGIGEEAGVVYVPDQPESGYFKILYESGILGVITVLWLMAATFGRAIATLTRNVVPHERKSEVIAALAALAVFAVTFSTLFTTTDQRMLALFAIFMALLWQPSAPPSNPATRS